MPAWYLQLTQMNDAGNMICNYAHVIPGGVIVFFPSYAYLNDVVLHWTKSQIIARLSKKKQLFIESRNSGTGILAEYSSTVRQAGGAIMFAVVGGSLSEGINFSDELGRAVIVLGIPFANIKSPELVERMKNLDDRKMGITGRDYYENICMKQVNQCIGNYYINRSCDSPSKRLCNNYING